MTRESRTYIRTVGVSSYDLAILREFPDSVDLRLMKGTHNKIFFQHSSPKRNADSVNPPNKKH